MATSSDPLLDQDYVDSDEYIDIQLHKTRSTIKLTDMMTALVGIATLVTVYLLVFVVCDQWLIPGGFTARAREIMLAIVVLVAGTWLGIKVILPWRRRVSGLYAARTIENASPTLKSTLINLVDLSESGRKVRPEIYGSLERRAALALSHIDVHESVDRRLLLRLSVGLLATVVVFCLYTVFSPKSAATSLWRAIMPGTHVNVATRTQILAVRPGDKEIVAREQLEVTADLAGEIPPQTVLFFTTADHKFVDEPLEMRLLDEAAKQFRCVINGENGAGILQDMTYRIAAGDAARGPFNVHVIQPPSATIESIRLDYPAYMGRQPLTQSGGQIDAWEGTRVTLKAKANMPLRTGGASLQFFDDETTAKRAEEIPVHIANGTDLTVEWKLEIRADGTYPHHYRILCTNVAGESDRNPSLYGLLIRPDQPPEIVLRDPKTDLEMPANAVLPLVIEARDPDFRLKYINLKVQKNGAPVIGPEIFNGSAQQFKTTFEWSLQHQFKKDDVLTYWVEAQDNKQPIANSARTPQLRVRIVDPVSEQQARENLAAAKKRQKEELQTAEADTRETDPPREDQPADTDQKTKQGPKQPSKGEKSDPQKEDEAQNGQGQENGDPKQQDDPAQKGEQGENGKGGAGQKGAKEHDSAKNGAENERKLDPDNPADDPAAMQKILDREKDQRQKKDEKDSGQGGQEKSSGAKSADQKSQEDGKPNKAGAQPQDKSGDKKGQDGSAKKDRQDNPGAEQKKGDDQAGDNQQKQSKSKHEKPSQNEKDGSKASPEKQGNQKSDANRDASEASQEPQNKKGSDNEQSKDGGDNPAQTSSAKDPSKKDQGGDPSANKADPSKPEPGKGSGDKNAKENKEEGRPGPKDGDQSSKDSKELKEKGGAGKEAEQKPDSDASRQNSGDNEGQRDKAQTDQGKQQAGQDKNEGGEKSKENQGKQDKGDENAGNQESGEGDQKGKREPDPRDQSKGRDDSKSEQNNGEKEDGKTEAGHKQDAAKPDAVGNTSPSQQADGDKASDRKSANKANRKDQKQDGNKKSADKSDADKPNPDKPNVDQQSAQEKAGDPSQKKADKLPASDHPASDDDLKSQKAVEGKRDRRNERKERALPTGDKLDDPPPNDIKAKKKSANDAGDLSDSDQGAQVQQKAGQKESAAEQDRNAKDQEQATDQKSSTSPKEGQQGKKGAAQNQQDQKASGQKQQAQKGDSKPEQESQDQNAAQQGGKEGQKQGGKEGAQGKSDDANSGKQKSQSAQGKPGDSGSKGSDSQKGGSKGDGASGKNKSVSGGGHNSGTGGEGGSEGLEDTTKQANLEFAKKATDLALRRLEGQLKRGQIDKKLQEELGWNEEQIRRFVERMRHQSQGKEDPNSPESRASRLQFEETLRSLDLRSAGQRRIGSKAPKTHSSEIEGRRSVPSAEYRDLYEAFTRSISKQRPTNEK